MCSLMLLTLSLLVYVVGHGGYMTHNLRVAKAFEYFTANTCKKYCKSLPMSRHFFANI